MDVVHVGRNKQL